MTHFQGVKIPCGEWCLFLKFTRHAFRTYLEIYFKKPLSYLNLMSTYTCSTQQAQSWTFLTHLLARSFDIGIGSIVTCYFVSEITEILREWKSNFTNLAAKESEFDNFN